ncbi:MAG: YibE/F family protein [Lachnospiraceae bacterium]|nr:YibE/F family protein [Robinsoniella sp.]MDY3765485.1 YibE/F family protein [Lachnospiraceae bacterium]
MRAIRWTKKHIVSLLAIILMGVLMILPTGYEDALIYQGTERVRAKVTETDESSVYNNGLIQSGEQYCKVEILDGEFKGENSSAVNMLSGSLESDKIFKVGDIANVVISHKNGEILSITMSDHYRIDKEAILALIFVALLVFFAGRKGFRAIYSFIITILTIWKILVPAYLGGMNPVWVAIGITTFLTLVIIWLVYGFDRKTLAASGGSMLGVLVTCVMGILFTDQFKIHGAVMAYSETLLYSGYQNLNLTQIFMSSIFFGASGAMMDLSVDITSAVYEVIQKKPEIGWKEAAQSGMNVGRAAMGTMTTTLLLAYSGGYIALLMVFMAQGTPIDQILNYKYVSAEILDTVVGSMGLVTVAPFTALVSGILLTRKKKDQVTIKES